MCEAIFVHDFGHTKCNIFFQLHILQQAISHILLDSLVRQKQPN